MQLSEALKGFVFSKQADGRSPHTIYGYRRYIGMLAEFLHDPDVAAIRLTDLRAFMVWVQTEYKPQRKNGDTSPLSHHSLDSYWIAIKAFFSWTEQDLELANRPDKKLARPRYVRKVVTPFTEDEIRALIKASERKRVTVRANGHAPFTTARPTAIRDAALIYLLLDTGLRASELTRLRVGDVNLDSGEVYVATFGAGVKSRSRHVYIGVAARKALWRYLAKRERLANDDRLFLTSEDKPMNKDNLRAVLMSIGERANVVNVHPQRFRHTFAIQMLRNGVDLVSLQRLMGHADITTTRFYIALAGDDAHDAHRRASPVDRWRLRQPLNKLMLGEWEHCA